MNEVTYTALAAYVRREKKIYAYIQDQYTLWILFVNSKNAHRVFDSPT